MSGDESKILKTVREASPNERDRAVRMFETLHRLGPTPTPTHSSGPSSSREDFLRSLVAEGLVRAECYKRPSRERVPRKPVVVLGKPLSETVIEGRA